MDAQTILVSLFVLISAMLLAISWRSLRTRGSHGFYRFFAWEALLAIILLNVRVWFRDPFGWLQILSWVILFGSVLILVLGVRELGVRGKSGNERGDESLMDFEKTTSLVTTGVYRFVRHPLYASLMYLAWGAFLKDITWYCAILVVAATVALVATAKADEKECKAYFGEAYERYMERTKMFVPLLF